MVLTSISLSLLALIAGMYLLDKTKKEGLGKFYNFISWTVIVVSMLTMLCALTGGGIKMRRHHLEDRMECGLGKMDKDCFMPMGGHCGGGRMDREECKEMMDKEHCREMMGGGKMKGKCCEEMEEENDEDGMEKEIHIEKDTVKK